MHMEKTATSNQLVSTRYAASGAGERSGIRDLSFSNFHRALDRSFFLCDIDYAMTDWMIYDGDDQTLAIIEEKSSRLDEVKLGTSQMRALRNLSNKADVPLFLMISHMHGKVETDGYMSFWMQPLNNIAHDIFVKLGAPTSGAYLSEQRYYQFECYLRRKPKDPAIMQKLSAKAFKFVLPIISK